MTVDLELVYGISDMARNIERALTGHSDVGEEDLETTIVDMLHATAELCRQHTGEPIYVSFIQPEAEI